MTAAKGPKCVVCLKRVSARRVTRCPFCRRVLCMDCLCPDLGVYPHPPRLEEDR